MNRWFLSLIAAGIGISSQVYGDIFTGPTTLSEKTFDTLIVTGPLQFSDIEVLEATQIIGPIRHSEKGSFKQLKIIGPLQAKKVQCGELTVVGPVDICDWTVKQLKIIGPLQAKKVQCGELTVVGPVDICDWTVKHLTDVVGPLCAKNSTFSDVTVTSNKVVFKNTVVNNLIIKQTDEKIQELFLKGSTTINGNITFESGNGKIIVENTAQIKGSIKGAKST